ncbi:GGDEF domain-containing protein [Undibacterium sp. Jales W-56]|uniref:GGDEF domain-containing protein n=1 Tax=Undibacterium sp. Jales W-56 TaxID=2897325 RepID=UPI0021CEAD04|nr:GGDEF domain-containing protein [Undibacterium sp. Jales W-56]MCU6435376.1 GGDEF domain-containing protein [Undibacterium sp. Jales W-56]
MSNNPNSSQFKTPTDIARETFRRLAIQRIAPTPDAYRKLYQEISGVSEELPETKAAKPAEAAQETQPSAAEKLLLGFAENLKQSPGELANFGNRFSRAIKSGNWDDYSKGLTQLAEKTIAKPGNAISLADPVPAAPTSMGSNSISLVDDVSGEDSRPKILQDLLYRTLTLALASVLKPNPALATESESLGLAVRDADSEAALNQVASRLKHLCFQIELSSGDTAEQQELLLRLFGLLLDNVHELLDEDNWLRGQIEMVQSLIAGPIDHRTLQEATRSLKDVIYKQGVLKHSIDESKTSVKNMMATFIDRLSVMTVSTETYHSKMGGYAEQIRHSKDVIEVDQLIAAILDETHVVRSETMRSHEMMIVAQKEVKEAEVRIKELEDKLAHMSELVREDQLTGSLNRRGLDDVFEREADRADRRGSPLCAAMLDLDNFKKLNDTHGHAAGDEALVHLVRIVKKTLRSIDVIARYGGEEFLIVMPETNLDEAALAMTRVQRELTTHFFTMNEQRLFITFSAGVALRAPNESQEAVVQRADKAMYEAKKTGKNRVIKAT